MMWFPSGLNVQSQTPLRSALKRSDPSKPCPSSSLPGFRPRSVTFETTLPTRHTTQSTRHVGVVAPYATSEQGRRASRLIRGQLKSAARCQELEAEVPDAVLAADSASGSGPNSKIIRHIANTIERKVRRTASKKSLSRMRLRQWIEKLSGRHPFSDAEEQSSQELVTPRVERWQPGLNAPQVITPGSAIPSDGLQCDGSDVEPGGETDIDDDSVEATTSSSPPPLTEVTDVIQQDLVAPTQQSTHPTASDGYLAPTSPIPTPKTPWNSMSSLPPPSPNNRSNDTPHCSSRQEQLAREAIDFIESVLGALPPRQENRPFMASSPITDCYTQPIIPVPIWQQEEAEVSSQHHDQHTRRDGNASEGILESDNPFLTPSNDVDVAQPWTAHTVSSYGAWTSNPVVESNRTGFSQPPTTNEGPAPTSPFVSHSHDRAPQSPLFDRKILSRTSSMMDIEFASQTTEPEVQDVGMGEGFGAKAAQAPVPAAFPFWLESQAQPSFPTTSAFTNDYPMHEDVPYVFADVVPHFDFPNNNALQYAVPESVIAPLTPTSYLPNSSFTLTPTLDNFFNFFSLTGIYGENVQMGSSRGEVLQTQASSHGINVFGFPASTGSQAQQPWPSFYRMQDNILSSDASDDGQVANKTIIPQSVSGKTEFSLYSPYDVSLMSTYSHHASDPAIASLSHTYIGEQSIFTAPLPQSVSLLPISHPLFIPSISPCSPSTRPTAYACAAKESALAIKERAISRSLTPSPSKSGMAVAASSSRHGISRSQPPNSPNAVSNPFTFSLSSTSQHSRSGHLDQDIATPSIITQKAGMTNPIATENTTEVTIEPFTFNKSGFLWMSDKFQQSWIEDVQRALMGLPVDKKKRKYLPPAGSEEDLMRRLALEQLYHQHEALFIAMWKARKQRKEAARKKEREAAKRHKKSKRSPSARAGAVRSNPVVEERSREEGREPPAKRRKSLSVESIETTSSSEMAPTPSTVSSQSPMFSISQLPPMSRGGSMVSGYQPFLVASNVPQSRRSTASAPAFAARPRHFPPPPPRLEARPIKPKPARLCPFDLGTIFTKWW